MGPENNPLSADENSSPTLHDHPAPPALPRFPKNDVTGTDCTDSIGSAEREIYIEFKESRTFWENTASAKARSP